MALLIRQLTINRGNTQILHDLNLSVRKGTITGIVGLSGTGKSTLLGAIAGFFPIQQGQIELIGRVGYCFQNHSLYPFMTVRQNIAFGLSDLPPENRRARITEVLDKIGLSAFGDKYPPELSGGQQQRVALGRAIAYQPDVLLLDEPFSALDIHTRDHLIFWVADLIREAGTTTFLVTHYIDEALLLCDRVLILKNQNIAHEIDLNFAFPKNLDTLRYTAEFQEKKLKIQNLITLN